MIYLAYVVLALCVVVVSIKCADYVDLIDKKTKLSGAFIGGVILAAVTSLPELITSITAIVVVKNPGLVMGNVLGSNIFNLSILAVLVLFSVKNFIAAKIAKSHLITLICTLVVYFVLTICITFKYDIAFFGVSIASVAIFIVYLISVRYLSSDSTQNENKDTSPLTVKQVVIRFIIAAILLVIASVLITYVTNIIESQLNLGASLAGALFLGIATSLPELSSSVALVRHKNYNAMVGNIVGSNMFNYTILLVSDIMYNVGSIYTVTANKQTNSLILFGFLASIATLFILIHKKAKKQYQWLHALLCVLVVVFYILFIVFSK